MTLRRGPLRSAVVGIALTTAIAGCGADATKDPASAKQTAASTDGNVTVTITADGCAAEHSTYPAGPLVFTVTNKDATAVSEVELLQGQRIIGEKENMPPGFSGSFSLNVDAGDYVLYCPGAKTDRSPFKVTGTTTSTGSTTTSQLLVQGTKEYAGYVREQAAGLVAAVRPLDSAIQAGDLVAARTAYKKSRAYYEHIEPVAESFTIGKNSLDADIDARAGDVPTRQWQGFHRIEKGLFKDDSVAGLAGFSRGLLKNTQKLQQLVAHLSYQPAELANGAVSLLDEVAKTKITGEEERYSHIDLLDFSANVEGAQQAFANLQPGLKRIDPALTDSVSGAFGRLNEALAKYRSAKDPSGFVLYTSLTDQDTTALAHALQAVAEPLSRVAGKVVGG